MTLLNTERIHRLTAVLAEGLHRLGCEIKTACFFDTIFVATGTRTAAIHAAARSCMATNTGRPSAGWTMFTAIVTLCAPSSGASILRWEIPAIAMNRLKKPAAVDSCQRYTSTGTLQCVSTLAVSLPNSNPANPRRPCDAIKIRSQALSSAALMMPSNGTTLLA